jgi:hypothetical protein
VVVLLSVLALSDEILAYLDSESALGRGEKSRMEIVNELCSCIHILNVSYYKIPIKERPTPWSTAASEEVSASLTLKVS